MFLGVLFIEFLTIPKTCVLKNFKRTQLSNNLYDPNETDSGEDEMEKHIIPSSKTLIKKEYKIKTSNIFLLGSFVYLILDNLYLGITLNNHMKNGAYYVLELLFNRFPLYLTIGTILKSSEISIKLILGIILSVIPNLFSLITYFYAINQMNPIYFVLLFSIGILIDMTYLLVDSLIRKNCITFCYFSVECIFTLYFPAYFKSFHQFICKI